MKTSLPGLRQVYNFGLHGFFGAQIDNVATEDARPRATESREIARAVGLPHRVPLNRSISQLS
jgi:hypothetical protein